MAGEPPIGLFVGLTTVDVVHRAPAPPGRNEKITAAHQVVSAGGPAANAAVTFAALGGRARLLTALGSTGPARLAAADLEEHGVDVVDAAGPDHPLAVSAVLVLDSGERSVVSADGALREVAAPPAVDVPAGGVVLLDGHHPALARAALAAVAAAEPGARPAVVLDAGRWRGVFGELLPAADVAVLSSDFRLPGTAGGGEDLARAVLGLGARAVVITAGGDPVRWWTADGSGSHPVQAVQVRDTLGAGDAFHGAFAAAVALGEDVPGAVVRAAEIATERVRHVGPRRWLDAVRPWWSA